MRRYTQLALAAIVAAGIGAASLLPNHTHGASALDFWSWDGVVRGEGSGPQLGQTDKDGATTVTISTPSERSRPNGSRGR